MTVQPLKNELIPAFATPILLRKWPNFEPVNAGLRALILDREPPNPPPSRSVVGGWHSEQDVLDWGGEAIAELKQWISMAVTDLTIGLSRLTEPPEGKLKMTAWANVLRRGGYHQVHDHSTYAYAGVYYIEVGESDPGQIVSGDIEFIDPRVAMGAIQMPGMPFKQRVQLKPEPGLMVVFPAWLKHYVHPYQGPGIRITIAFNVTYDMPFAEAP